MRWARLGSYGAFVSRFQLDFYEDEQGDSPVLRWLRDELTPTQRRAIGVALAEILQAEGIGVCRTSYGKQLGDGLFEFRLRHDAAEILRSVGEAARLEPRSERILLRVFCHAHGDRIVLLLGGVRQRRRSECQAPAARDRRSPQAPQSLPRPQMTSVARIWVRGHNDPRSTMPTFDDFIAELEAEARAEGPEAVAELEAFRLHFSLARQLGQQRRAQHLTQKQLADRSGIDQAEISRIERGQSNPTTATLGALTRALGLDVRLVASTGAA
jgi:DNA-binding XRE family transcriptional regulator